VKEMTKVDWQSATSKLLRPPARPAEEEASGSLHTNTHTMGTLQHSWNPNLFLHRRGETDLKLGVLFQQAVILLGEAFRLLPHGQSFVFGFL
jgi:hypothetical protein